RPRGGGTPCARPPARARAARARRAGQPPARCEQPCLVGAGAGAAGDRRTRLARRERGGLVSAIPLADAPALRAPARRTFAVRATLAAVAIGATVAFLLDSRHPQTRTVVALPRDASTVILLDLSASISTDTYARIGG